MENLPKSIAQQAGILIGLLLIATALLFLAWLRTLKRLKGLESRWASLMEGATGRSIEAKLDEHLEERLRIVAQLDDTRQRVEVLEDKMEGSKRHLGIVRYDAFEEVGGSQSFALALYDDRGDGVILTSLVGRTDCRVYGKPLNRGRSERTLSQEEQRAIDEGKRNAPRPTLTS